MQLRSLLCAAARAWLGGGQASSTGEPAGSRQAQAGLSSPLLHGVLAQPPAQPPSLAPLVQQVRSTVVGVTTQRRSLPLPFGRTPESGLGSGVIVDAAGLVVTNYHVVAQAQEVVVRTSDEREYVARVRGGDPATDLALLELQDVSKPLTPASLGNSDALRVGDYVVAIGNPFGLELTVTAGIVSAKARVIGAGPYDEFLQTDAAINPGNSGGPLFGLDGQVVGINTAIVAGGQGIGFAVPIDLVEALLPQLRERGRVVRGFLGVGVQDLTADLGEALGLPTEQGAVVASVEPGSPAARVGLVPGDVVVSFQGEPVSGAAELSRRVSLLAPGTRVQLGVVREGSRPQLEAPLGERPPEGQGALPEGAPPPPEPEEGDALGLTVQPLPRQTARRLGVESGLIVAGVEPGSRSARAGLRRGDVLLEADRRSVRTPEDLEKAVRSAGDQPLVLRILRDQRALYLAVPPAGQGG